MLVELRRAFVRRINSSLRKRGFEITKLQPNSVHEWESRTSHPIPVMPFLCLLKERMGDVFFVQIGANDGVRFDDLFEAVKTLDLSGLAVEPMTGAFECLVKNYADQTKVTAVHAAIDSKSGTRVLYKVDENMPNAPSFVDGIASFDPTHHQKSGISSDYIVTENVKCMTFDELTAEHDVSRVDFIQTDTEGYDGKILMSIDWNRWRPACVRFEYASLEDDELNLVTKTLVANGYTLFRDQENAFAVQPSVL